MESQTDKDKNGIRLGLPCINGRGGFFGLPVRIYCLSRILFPPYIMTYPLEYLWATIADRIDFLSIGLSVFSFP
jgi:hypothetical protein